MSDPSFLLLLLGVRQIHKKLGFAFAGSQICGWLAMYVFSLCWDLMRSACHRGQLSGGLQGQRSPPRQKIADLQQTAIGHRREQRPKQTESGKKPKWSFLPA